MNPKYNYVKPQIQTDTYSKTIYPDGSMIIYSIEKIEPEIATRSIRKINAYKVQLNGFAITMSFTIDARRDTKKNRAIIDAQYNEEVRVIGGTWTEDAYGYKKAGYPKRTHGMPFTTKHPTLWVVKDCGAAHMSMEAKFGENPAVYNVVKTNTLYC